MAYSIHKILAVILLVVFSFNSFVLTAEAANSHSGDFGGASYFYVADNATLSITGKMAISASVRLGAGIPNNTAYTVVSKYNFDTANRSYRFMLNDSGGTEQLLYANSVDGAGGGSVTTATVNQTLTPGQWYRVGVSYDTAGTVEFCLDGASLGSVGSMNTSQYDSNADFAIGVSNTTGVTDYYSGLIDDVIIYNTTKTCAQLNNTAETCTPLAADIKGYWKLNNNTNDETAVSNLTGVSAAYSTTVPFSGDCSVPGSTKKRRIIFLFWR